MSGHSHAQNVKSTKEAGAKKRSKNFEKVNRLILVAVKEGGPNPDTNAQLRAAIDKGRDFNMPKDNIEKTIKRASGDVEKQKLENFLFEAYGPGKIAVMIEGITDNRNRALGEVKKILGKYNGKLVQKGSINWKFERKGYADVNLEEQDEKFRDKETLELMAIEAGADDVNWHEGNLEVYVDPQNTNITRQALEKEGVKVKSIGIEWKPNETEEVTESEKESCLKLFEDLDDCDDVQDIYSNLAE